MTTACNVMIGRWIRWGEPCTKVLSQLVPCETTIEPVCPNKRDYEMANVSLGLHRWLFCRRRPLPLVRLGHKDQSPLVTGF